MKAFALALIGAAMLSAPAHAEDPATTADLRCSIVGLTIAGSGVKESQAAGMMSLFYYLGRLDGRTPDLDLENRLIDEVAIMKPADFKAEAQRCGAFMVTRGLKLQELGKRIMERAAKSPPNPAIPN